MTTPSYRRRTSIYALDIPCEKGEKNNLLDRLQAECPAQITASLPTVDGVVLAFRTGTDQQAIDIADELLPDGREALLRTGLGANERLVAVNEPSVKLHERIDAYRAHLQELAQYNGTVPGAQVISNIRRQMELAQRELDHRNT